MNDQSCTTQEMELMRVGDCVTIKGKKGVWTVIESNWGQADKPLLLKRLGVFRRALESQLEKVNQ